MREKAFTMIKLLVALAILALMLSIAAPRYFGHIDKAKEDVLREDLFVMRDAIDKFYADRNRYPSTLNELMIERYIRKIPVDPFTESSTSWTVVPATDPSLGLVYDVHSGALATARDGTLVKEW